ncbi:MAG: nuclear transport factor 2 family protein [Pseudomonadota bacterium]
MTARATAEALYEAYARGDLEATFALLAVDVNHTANACNHEQQFCGTYHGIDAVRARVAEIAEHWAFEIYAPQTIIEEGDRVAAMVKLVAVERHTGVRLESLVAHFMVVKDGKITELIEVFDGAHIEAAMAHAA